MRRVPAADDVTLAVDVVQSDPESGVRAVAAAEAEARRMTLAGPVRLGTDPSADAAALRVLAEATARRIDLAWQLAADPGWPVRALTHLLPPAGCADPGGREFVASWRRSFRLGACTYRRGPDFVALRDIRPGGRQVRAVLGRQWVAAFDELVGQAVSPTGEAGRQLLDELVAIQFALRLDARHHVVLAYRPPRWSLPATGT
jgi:hypothetical protein